MMKWEEQKKELIERIRSLLNEKEHVLIGIDGRCASGKTTLAEELHRILGGNLIHMDDFFLRPQQRTAERYAEPGGNVDRERFLKEVMIPLREGKDFSYRPFDCQTMKLKDPVKVRDKKLMIVEGSYCLYPSLQDFYDLKVFLDVDRETQWKRIEKRNPDKLDAFRDRWIPYEEKYFDAFQIREKCDVILNSENAF